MKLKKIIYARKDKYFKENGCIHIWSADYPNITRKIYVFCDINSISTKMGIGQRAREIEEEVKKRNGESLFVTKILV